MKGKKIVIISLFLIVFLLSACNGNDGSNDTVFLAEFRVGVTDEEIANVLTSISEHSLVYNYEFTSREEIIEELTKDLIDEATTGNLRHVEIVDIIKVEVINIDSLEEVLEFVYALEPIIYIYLPRH